MGSIGKRIWIDPGHGGRDPGAVGPDGRCEKADNLRFALALGEAFRSRGCQVVFTRTDDRPADLTARTRLERESRCDLAISCHRNAGPETAAGVEIWLHSQAPASYVAWAAGVVEGLRQAGMGVRTSKIPQRAADGVFRGYRDDPTVDYAVNRETSAPSMLLELGFVTSPQDNRLFDAQLEALAQAVAAASCGFLGLPEAEPGPEEENLAPAQPPLSPEERHRALLQELEALVARYQ